MDVFELVILVFAVIFNMVMLYLLQHVAFLVFGIIWIVALGFRSYHAHPRKPLPSGE